jgi:hypothetical protein
MKKMACFKRLSILAVFGLASIVGCGESTKTTNTPQGAWKTQQTITNRYLPADFSAIMGTAHIATMSKNQAGAVATIEVDYMRLIEDDPATGTKVLAENHYDIDSTQGLSINQGALYDRSPVWYGNDDHHVPMTNSSIQNSVLKIDMSTTPDNIAHWWTDRKPCKQGATYYVEMRVKITGQVGLQFGADFWRDMTSSWAGDNVNNREYFNSDWYGDTNGQFIVVKGPRY